MTWANKSGWRRHFKREKTGYYDPRWGVTIERNTDPTGERWVVWGTPQFGCGERGVQMPTIALAVNWFENNIPSFGP